MSYESEDEAGLPDRVLASLRADPKPPTGLEEKTIARLRAADELTAHARSRQWRWVPHAIAAAMLFGAGVAFGYGGHTAQRALMTPSQRIQSAAADYIQAMDAASNDDDEARTIAGAAFRSTAYHMFQRFPDDQLGMIFNMTLNRISLIPPGTPGREARSVWY